MMKHTKYSCFYLTVRVSVCVCVFLLCYFGPVLLLVIGKVRIFFLIFFISQIKNIKHKEYFYLFREKRNLKKRVQRKKKKTAAKKEERKKD